LRKRDATSLSMDDLNIFCNAHPTLITQINQQMLNMLYGMLIYIYRIYV